ncbi:MAG TPA: MlaD family protein [Aliidongia sp.]|uniref:PqiB family protein n=1 Tax=Aliidongia sp. TaxID=1914230 RepID=UPI002DDD652A|nr:MlaD family protein [Aliidongia sp.]HEV2673023.1 MlaD family protein [Aliidongia sp.]
MPEHQTPRLATHERHRFPLVWIVPIVALAAAGWLGYRTLSERGSLVAITLQSAEGLEAGKTKIKHRDIELGIVEAMEPSADLSSVTIQARMNRYAEPHLGSGTRFWVVRPRLSAEGISGLGTLISGSYIEMEPGPGEPARRFVALEDPPVVSADVPGTRYVLRGLQLGSVSQGAPVSFHGVKVGEVLGYQLSDDDGTATVQVFVRAPHDKLVHEGTRFWNASGISIDVGSEGLRVESESIQAILAGGVAFDVPRGGDLGPPAKPEAAFRLYGDADKARDALFTRKVPFLLHLTGSAQGLSAGNIVRMHGIRVGEVTDVHMEYDTASGAMTVPVTFEVEPQRIRLLHADLSEAGFEERSYGAFKSFVAQGLRARLASGNLLTGQKIISLDFLPDAPRATLIEGGLYPEIPTIEADDLDSIMQSAKALLGSLQSTVTSLDQVITSPEVKQSVRSLQGALANLDRLTHDVSLQTGPLLTSLKAVSSSADQMLKQATTTLAVTGDAFGGEGEAGGDLAGTLSELKQAARSLHALTDYLEKHPESLIQGKSAGATR